MFTIHIGPPAISSGPCFRSLALVLALCSLPGVSAANRCGTSWVYPQPPSTCTPFLGTPRIHFFLFGGRAPEAPSCPSHTKRGVEGGKGGSRVGKSFFWLVTEVNGPVTDVGWGPTDVWRLTVPHPPLHMNSQPLHPPPQRVASGSRGLENTAARIGSRTWYACACDCPRLSLGRWAPSVQV